ncbi:ABC transporter permease [Parasulfitobacter algicola]|uniref:ABC transporter permease subunit n=1 Tax=Parasulfitobacter algicola TaxID=2614809 RepID=A0ABX2IYG3_9RHOB|nr:ABC transporter permease subunit [Sulfitobacter algicola]NSX56335.1 ABC transporter permease subunit [Sulfitobacter algicola]
MNGRHQTERFRFAWLPYLTLFAMLGPLLAGLAGTVAPAFGYMPALGTRDLSLDVFRSLMAWPGLYDAVRLSVTTGFLATAISLGIVTLITAGWVGTKSFRILERLLSPLLSVPHAAAAFGFAFLIMPSGWIARLLSPWLTGWDRPPDVLIVQDPYGLAMTAGLIAKEVPFLLLMVLAALSQSNGTRRQIVAQALGYGRVTGWLKTVFPSIYSQIRLPVYVVLAYSMSVVDVAIILGPNTPPTLSVQIIKWMNDPDLSFRLQAAAGALAQFLLVIAAMLVWRMGELFVAFAGRRWIVRGRRQLLDKTLRTVGFTAGVITAASIILGLAGLVLWSFAGFWSYPDILPDNLSLRSWARSGAGLSDAAFETMIIAFASTLIAVFLTIGCLEAEYRYNLRITRRSLLILYLPLMVPQTAFLPGLQTLLLTTGADTGRLPVILTHLVFVLPYVFLSLGDPFRSWDTRYATTASALGAGPDRVLWRIRLPMLLAPVLTAMAVGFAVSVGQYLPTLLIGGGRLQTLTTEAVALAAGGDRRVIGVYGLAQTTAALLPFLIAILLPAFLWRNRKALRHG